VLDLLLIGIEVGIGLADLGLHRGPVDVRDRLVDEHESPVAVLHKHEARVGIDHLAQQLLGRLALSHFFLQRLLRVLLLREVAHERSEQPVIGQPDGRDRQLDGKLASVPVQRGDLDALPQDRPFSRLEKPREPARMPFPMLRWNDRRGEAATDRLRGGPAEHGLGGRAPARDPARLIHGDAGVQRAVEQRLEPCFGSAHRFLCSFALDGHRHLGGHELEDVLLALPNRIPSV